MSLLPKKKERQSFHFQELIHLYYGAPGVGKTTFASELPEDNLFIATEDGQRALEVFNVRIDTWEEFLKVISAFEKGEGENFRSITIDTVDNLMNFCEDYVCKKHRITHMSDEEWGKGWSALKNEFKRAISLIQKLKKGIVFISHAKEVEVKTRSLKINKWIPTFSKQCRDVVIPLVDEMFFFTVKEALRDKKIVSDRLVYTQPGETWEAKDRLACFPYEMPMDCLEFINIYNNKYSSKEPKKIKRVKKQK